MYQHILIPLDLTSADDAILKHIRGLARLAGSRLTLLHVSDGFMAQNQERFDESLEIKNDRAYLERRRDELAAEGFTADCVLLCGKPADQILAYAGQCGCDLIAMGTHGHTGLQDLILGSVAPKIRHHAQTPVLLVRAARE